MKPLKIIAHLFTGFHSAFDWSVSIDGILAYQSQLKKLGDERFKLEATNQQSLTVIDDLPIEKEYFNDLWWYQCSRPFFYVAATYTKHIHRRFNAQEAEQYANKIGKIETTKGPLKNSLLYKTVYITNKVIWYVNGDKDAIEKLLADVTHIGACRGGGMGAVREWAVTEHENLEDCRLKRVLPIDFAKLYKVNGVQLTWAIRPPSLLISNQFDCVMPENAG
jgi:CRISPR type IV-associated protein Csf3